MDTHNFNSMSHIPDHFMPAIGQVMVQHAFMDSKLQNTICLLSGMSYNAGVSVLAPVTTTKTRATMLQHLARTMAKDLSYLCKLLVLGDVIAEVSNERNIIAHTIPYFYSPSTDEIGYFKEVNKTNPQISQQPPYTATVKSLYDLAGRIQLVGIWLGMLQPNCLPNGIMREGMNFDEVVDAIKKHATRHPDWDNDACFPWQDRFRGKVDHESRKPLNSQRIPKDPPQSSEV